MVTKFKMTITIVFCFSNVKAKVTINFYFLLIKGYITAIVFLPFEASVHLYTYGRRNLLEIKIINTDQCAQTRRKTYYSVMGKTSVYHTSIWTRLSGKFNNNICYGFVHEYP